MHFTHLVGVIKKYGTFVVRKQWRMKLVIKLMMNVTRLIYDSIDFNYTGTCSLSDSAYMMGIGLLFLLFCLILGLISVRKIRRQSEKQYNNLVILDR